MVSLEVLVVDMGDLNGLEPGGGGLGIDVIEEWICVWYSCNYEIGKECWKVTVEDWKGLMLAVMNDGRL